VKNLELRDESLILRRARKSEAPLLSQAVRDSLAELAPYLPWASEAYDVEVARAFLDYSREEAQAARGNHLSIFDVQSGELIGGVGLMMRPTFESAELGYWIASRRSGEGIATQASGLLMEYGFSRLALRRISLTCDVENAGSRRVAEKLGMRREGRMVEYARQDGVSHDHYLYAILATEFRPASRG
jgi:RimJ/RimL family protein N-acetyltransferase